MVAVYVNGDAELGVGQELEECATTNKNKERRALAGYSYTYHKALNDGITRWRCDQRGSAQKCKAAIRVEGSLVRAVVSGHNHMPSGGRKQALEVRSAIRKHAKGTAMATHRILATNTANCPAHVVAALPTNGTLQRGIRRQRNTGMGILTQPHSQDDLSILPDRYAVLEDETPFLVRNAVVPDGRVLVFATPSMLDWMARATMFHSDGTFKKAPNLFPQLYSVHCILLGVAIPVLYAFLPSKSQDTYEYLFRVMKELCPRLEPEGWMADFELSSQNAVRAVFGIEPSGCFYHLNQSVYRHVQSEGLVTAYGEENGRLALTTGLLTSLAFVPPADVYHRFQEILNWQEIDPRAARIIDYFEENYIGMYRRGVWRDARYPPVVWNVRARTLGNDHRTDNPVEGWHNRLRHTIQGGDHPSVWHVIMGLMEETRYQEQRVVNLVLGRVPARRAKYVELDQRVLSITIDYPPINLAHPPGRNFDEFLRALAHIFHYQ